VGGTRAGAAAGNAARVPAAWEARIACFPLCADPANPRRCPPSSPRGLPPSCVVVEDSRIGLKAAKAAGMTCIVTKSSYTQNEDFTGADRVVDSLDAGGVTLEGLAELAASRAARAA
jgi:hypothetical protein